MTRCWLIQCACMENQKWRVDVADKYFKKHHSCRMKSILFGLIYKIHVDERGTKIRKFTQLNFSEDRQRLHHLPCIVKESKKGNLFFNELNNLARPKNEIPRSCYTLFRDNHGARRMLIKKSFQFSSFFFKFSWNVFHLIRRPLLRFAVLIEVCFGKIQ